RHADGVVRRVTRVEEVVGLVVDSRVDVSADAGAILRAELAPLFEGVRDAVTIAVDSRVRRVALRHRAVDADVGSADEDRRNRPADVLAQRQDVVDHVAPKYQLVAVTYLHGGQGVADL